MIDTVRILGYDPPTIYKRCAGRKAKQMSNLKKDIEEIIDEHADAVLEARDEANTGRAVELQDKADQRATTQIINLIESVVDSVSPSKYQTPTSYKKAIKSKLIGEE